MKRLARHRDADHGKDRMCGNDSAEMSCHSCGADDDLDAAFFGVFCVFRRGIRRPVCGKDSCFKGKSELFQCIECPFQRREIALAAHDDGDICGHFTVFLSINL